MPSCRASLIMTFKAKNKVIYIMVRTTSFGRCYKNLVVIIIIYTNVCILIQMYVYLYKCMLPNCRRQQPAMKNGAIFTVAISVLLPPKPYEALTTVREHTGLISLSYWAHWACIFKSIRVSFNWLTPRMANKHMSSDVNDNQCEWMEYGFPIMMVMAKAMATFAIYRDIQ